MAEYAEDVTDLREAQRIIAYLRNRVAELVDEQTPLRGEFTAFLSDEDTDRLETLFRLGKLVYEQDPDMEFEDAFSQFVSEYLDMQWDLSQSEIDRPDITPSA